VIEGAFDGKRLELTEVRRVSHYPVRMGGDLYWDFPLLFSEMLAGLQASVSSGALRSIGIDTWGCDFGLLDRGGRLRSNPLSYRDESNDAAMKDVLSILGERRLYEQTGVVNMALNTVFQLFKHKQRGDLESVSNMLLLPDLFSYFLTGEISSEYTAATTTQLFGDGSWLTDVIRDLALPDDIFTGIVMPGTLKGIVNEPYGPLTGVRLVSVPGHDTACALESANGITADDVLISSGTWSMLGNIADSPFINDAGFTGGYSNYGAADGSLLVRDIAGMWIINNCKLKWESGGKRMAFSDIVEAAEAAAPFGAFIDPDDEEFYSAQDMPAAIMRKCTGIPPRTDGEIARCVFESLALKYRRAIEELEQVSGKKSGLIRIIGGGARNELLCQMVADACGRVCVCGPYEATAAGNVFSQLIAAGELERGQIGDVIKDSFELRTYEPKNTKRWAEISNEIIIDNR